ncbi:MAG: hypothetical protein WCA53_22230 [Caballeronia sp.]
MFPKPFSFTPLSSKQSDSPLFAKDAHRDRDNVSVKPCKVLKKQLELEETVSGDLENDSGIPGPRFANERSQLPTTFLAPASPCDSSQIHNTRTAVDGCLQKVCELGIARGVDGGFIVPKKICERSVHDAYRIHKV